MKILALILALGGYICIYNAFEPVNWWLYAGLFLHRIATLVDIVDFQENL